MKSTVLFVMILIIGGLGGIAAAELKPLFWESAPAAITNNSSVDAAVLEGISNDVKDMREDFEEKLNEKDILIKELQDRIETSEKEKHQAEDNVVSKNEEINKLQKQINTLRGIVSSIQQDIGNTVAKQIEKKEEEKKAAEEAARAERFKQMQEQAKKRQEEAYTDHTNKMKTELGLSDSQTLSIKEALNQRGEKLREMFTNRDNWSRENRDQMREKMDEIQKEWEESAKSVLTPKQYDEFVQKNLNRINEMGGGGRRPNRSNRDNNNSRPR